MYDLRKASAWWLLGPLIALSIISLLMCSGCASTGEARSDGAKVQHEVIVTKKQVLAPATESAPEHIVVLSETVERWLDEKTKTETHAETHTAPDLPAVASAANAGISLIPSGTGVGDLVKLIAGAGTAYLAMRGTVKSLKDQIDYHQKDAAEGWQKADERALKLPPQA
jgi:hypothetical protein